MLQLKNSTPFAASMAMFPSEIGVDTLYLIVKAGFNIGRKWTLVDEQIPPCNEDEYWGEPNQSSLKYASDFHMGKPSSDIIMTGQACAPEGQTVQQLDVSLSVGQVGKTIKVFGDREWRNGRISTPKPFNKMPIIYERAFGGVHMVDGVVKSSDARNPVGCGYSGDRSIDEMDGERLPNLEDPANIIQQSSDRPQPSCFAYSSASWQPRLGYAGSYDQAWQNKQAPYPPEDFDKRFFNCAHSDLIYPGYLSGGEAVKISNMHPDGEIQFNLPQINLVSEVSFDKDTQCPKFNLETLALEPNQLQLSMVWRASMSCDKRLLKVKQARIALTGNSE
jgi:hypothetical protein